MYRELQYFVPAPGRKVGEDGKRAKLELLKPMSGAAVPGQLTALMGGSGAGKVRLTHSCRQEDGLRSIKCWCGNRS